MTNRPHFRLEFTSLAHAIPGARALEAIFGQAEAAAWLDSSDEPRAAAEQPALSILTGTGGPWSQLMPTPEAAAAAPFDPFDPFHHMQDVLLAHPTLIPETWPAKFTLGWVGALGYELRSHTADNPGPLAHQSPHPDAPMFFTDRAIVCLHGSEPRTLIAVLTHDNHPLESAENRAWMAHTRTILADLATPPGPDNSDSQTNSGSSPQPHQHSRPQFTLDLDRSAYLHAIAKAKEHIRAGETYEVCLTTTARGPALQTFTDASPLQVYEHLRTVAPAPYAAFLQFKTTASPLTVLSASPERFLACSASGAISAKPIKGTRRRSPNPVADANIVTELRNNPKDRAENLMIVDLLRNDLGRVCTPGSVHVPSIFAVESFSHVHQLVSTIQGQLREGCTVAELLASSFPGGSMTGAPKSSTMRIIDTLEPRARGLYSGAIGWAGLDGAAEFSITIRTLVDDGNELSFGVGGAIVTDSDPDAEFDEILAKAAALLQAVDGAINNA